MTAADALVTQPDEAPVTRPLGDEDRQGSTGARKATRRETVHLSLMHAMHSARRH